MAMSRTKSFLPCTREELWRTDMQYDLTVSDSVEQGGWAEAALCSPVPAAVLLQHPAGLRGRADVGQGGWTGRSEWQQCLCQMKDDVSVLRDLLLSSRNVSVAFLLSHVVGWHKMDDRRVFGSSGILLKITFFSITSISDCNVCNNTTTFLTKTCWRDRFITVFALHD